MVNKKSLIFIYLTPSPIFLFENISNFQNSEVQKGVERVRGLHKTFTEGNQLRPSLIISYVKNQSRTMKYFPD